MPVARCVMPVPENFQTGKCPFARCPKKIKRANARCPLPDYSCPLASLPRKKHKPKDVSKKANQSTYPRVVGLAKIMSEL